jgi:hypothetical protein
VDKKSDEMVNYGLFKQVSRDILGTVKGNVTHATEKYFKD